MSELHLVFGTGPIGRYTAYTLREKGHRVRMVNRSGVMHDKPADVELMKSDACDAAQNTVITRGATSVYFCVAPSYTEWARTFPSLQQAVLDAAIANQTRLAVVENLYGYGPFVGALREKARTIHLLERARFGWRCNCSLNPLMHKDMSKWHRDVQRTILDHTI